MNDRDTPPKETNLSDLERMFEDMELLNPKGICEMCGVETRYTFCEGTYCEDCYELVRKVK